MLMLLQYPEVPTSGESCSYKLFLDPSHHYKRGALLQTSDRLGFGLLGSWWTLAAFQWVKVLALDSNTT